MDFDQSDRFSIARKIAPKDFKLPIQQSIRLISQIRLNQKLSKSLRPDENRKQYTQLLQWLSTRLQSTKFIIQSKQQSQYGQQFLEEQIQHEQSKIIQIAMKQLVDMFRKECKEKAQILEICMHYFTGLIQMFGKHYQREIFETIKTYNSNILDLEDQYGHRLDKCYLQIQQFQKLKQTKWRNIYMLAKDNRVLRRQKGKLLRTFNQQQLRIKQLQQQLCMIAKQNQMNKLIIRFQNDTQNLNIYMKNRTTLIKFQKIIQSRPSKALKVLNSQLIKLQIQEMNTLDDKIDYIKRVINDNGEVFDQYQDLNQLIFKPNKMVFNMYTQTDKQDYTDQIQTKQYGFSHDLTLTNQMFQLKQQKVNLKITPQQKSKLNQLLQSNNQIKQVQNKQSKFAKKQFHKKVNLAKRTIKRQYNILINSIVKKLSSSYIIQECMGIVYCPKFKIKPNLFFVTSFDIKFGKCFIDDPQPKIQQIMTKITPSNITKKSKNSRASLMVKMVKHQKMKLVSTKNIKQAKILDQSANQSNQQTSKDNKEDSKQSGIQNNLNFNSSKDINSEIKNRATSFSKLRKKDPNIKSYKPSKFSQQTQKHQQFQTQQQNIKLSKSEKQGAKTQKQGIKIQKQGTKTQKQYANAQKQNAKRQKQGSKTQKQYSNTQKQGRKVSKRLKTLESIRPKDSQLGQKSLRIKTSQSIRHSQIINNQISKIDLIKQQDQQSQMSRWDNQSKTSKNRYSYQQKNNSRISINRNFTTLKKHQEQQQSVYGNQSQRASNQLAQDQALFHFNQAIDCRILKPRVIQPSAFANHKQRQSLNKVFDSKCRFSQLSSRTSQIGFNYKQYLSQVQQKQKMQLQGENNHPIVMKSFQVKKLCQKIIKSISLRRKQILSSTLSWSLRNFIQHFLRQTYGNSWKGDKNILRYSFTVEDRLSSPTIKAFSLMMNVNVHPQYIEDLFRLYVTMIDKNQFYGENSFVTKRMKGLTIINYLLSIYFDQTTTNQIVKDIPFLDHYQLDLNQVFVVVQNQLRVHSLQTQIYQFLLNLLPQSQSTIQFSQLKQILYIFRNEQIYHGHLARLKFFFHSYGQNIIDQTQNLLNPQNIKNEKLTKKGSSFNTQKMINGLKNKNNKLEIKQKQKQQLNIQILPIHRLCLYLRRFQWKHLLQINEFLEEKYQNMVGVYIQDQVIRFITNYHTKLNQRSLKSRKIISHNSMNISIPIQQQIPLPLHPLSWLLQRAKQMIKSYYRYKTSLNRYFFMHLHLSILTYQVEQQLDKVFSDNLFAINIQYKKLRTKLQLHNFIK